MQNEARKLRRHRKIGSKLKSPGASGAKIDARRWRNRIVGQGEKPASWFLANPANWRIHPKPQQTAINIALDEVGWIQSVIVNKRTSELWGHDRNIETLVDGHLRIGQALSVSESEPVPFIYVDLTPDEEKKALATLDPIGAMAATDAEKLTELIDEMKSAQPAIDDMLANVLASANLESLNSSTPGSVTSNADALDKIKDQRRMANDGVASKNDTENYFVIVFPDRTAKEKALAKIGLPIDERYVSSASIQLQSTSSLVLKQSGRSCKAALPKDSGACG